MTSRRARAYGRVIGALERFGPAKLHADEDALIREAADTLLFIDGPDDREARAALERAVELMDRMVVAGRLEAAPARGLREDLGAVGPPGLRTPVMRG